LLADLYGEIGVPPAVWDEVTRRGIGAAELAQAPWLSVQRLGDTRLAEQLVGTSGLGRGESEAIALAHERGALVLLDDRPARRKAAELGLSVTGTLGLLLDAKHAGLIDALRPLVDDLVRMEARFSGRLMQDILELAGEDT